MPVPINLSGYPRFPVPSQEEAERFRWFQTLQAGVSALGSIRSSDVVSGPATGFAHTIAPNQGVLLLLPAAGLATGSVTLPPTALDGFQQEILSSQAVGVLTVLPSAGQTIVGVASLALAANVRIVFFWRALTNTWYRMQ